MGHAVGEGLQLLRIGILLCFLPAILYRIWRIWRYPTSVPAVAATSFGICVWVWLLTFTDGVWPILPPLVRAISAGGCWTVAVAGCLQVFVIGIRGDVSPARIRRGVWVTFTATAVALAVVTAAASRSEMLLTTSDMYAVIDSLASEGDFWSNTALGLSSGFALVVFSQLAWVGLRHADRTPVGTGLGLLAAASVFEIATTAIGGIMRPLGLGSGWIAGPVGLWGRTVTGCIGAILVIVGFLWPPVVMRIQARRDARRLRPLHNALGRAFPQLFPPDESRIRLSDLVFEWATHIQDGLTLLAQHRQTPVHAGAEVPQGVVDRASHVVNWLLDKPVPGFSCEWLRAPDGVSDEEWVLTIADRFRGCSGLLLVGKIRHHLKSAGS